jgi:hypothetical protein
LRVALAVEMDETERPIDAGALGAQ